MHEASLSTKLDVICCNTLTEWDDFSKIPFVDFSSFWERSLVTFDSVVGAVKVQEDTTLLSLLRLAEGMRASDPRDLLSTVLGIASDAGEFPLSNYALPVPDVFQSFASAFIAKGDGAAMLAVASSGDKARSCLSWFHTGIKCLLDSDSKNIMNFLPEDKADNSGY